MSRKAPGQSRDSILPEQKLNAISGLNVLHLRAAYFIEENNLEGDRHDPCHGSVRTRAATPT